VTPSAEQWKAVRLALERATAQGRFAGYWPLVRALPPMQFVWDADFLSDQAQAAMRIERDGSVTLAFRSDASPFSLVRSALHELSHCGDVPAILNGMTRETTEYNATRAGQLARDVYEIEPWLWR
jgi:hypothetical protein